MTGSSKNREPNRLVVRERERVAALARLGRFGGLAGRRGGHRGHRPDRAPRVLEGSPFVKDMIPFVTGVRLAAAQQIRSGWCRSCS